MPIEGPWTLRAISWRPLGQLFVEKGLLTEERLEHALAVQAATGGRLGEKLVELGYVSSSSLAQLLAEQYGVELRSTPASARASGPSSNAVYEKQVAARAGRAGGFSPC